MARVVFHHVSKIYEGGITAVRDFDLTVEEGELVVLVGPSGCGKSTVLRMVAGLEEITQGEISIGDRSVNQISPKDRDVAMVFQNYALYPHMTVYKNLAFGLKMRNFSRPEIDKRIRETAELLDIVELLDRKPKALSGGQRQRVAVGRAIVRNPKVFLFDEPLSNLDAKLRVQMRAELSRLHRRLKATMIYVTHDQLEAMTLGERIVVMKGGMIQQVDAPLRLYDSPRNQFVAGFIGTPPMNFFQGVVDRTPTGFAFNEGGFTVPLPERMNSILRDRAGKPVIFGIRPEEIRDADQAGMTHGDSVVIARLETVEPVGSESYWYLSTGCHSFVARVDAHAQAEVNREIRVAFNTGKSRLFDTETGEAIG